MLFFQFKRCELEDDEKSLKLQCLKDAKTAGQFSIFLVSGVYIQLKGSITRFRFRHKCSFRAKMSIGGSN